jgi:hypothetical protein
MILFVGLNDYMLRNLLCSSFPERARELELPLHGFVYPDSQPVYEQRLREQLNMASEPQSLQQTHGSVKAERLGRFARACRYFRAKNLNYVPFCRNSFRERGEGRLARCRLETFFLLARLGGALGLERPASSAFWNETRRWPLIREVCIPRLEELRPHVIVSGSPETPYDIPWLLAAAELSVKRVVWIRSWDNLTTKIGNLQEAEEYLVWSDLMEQELREYYPEYAGRPIHKIGTLQFDGHANRDHVLPRDDFCAKVGLDPQRPIVLYCTGGPHICPQEHVIIERVHSVLSSAAFAERPQLLVRLHPYSWNTDLRIHEHLRNVAVWPRESDLPSMLGGSTTGLVDDYRVMISSFFHAAVNVNVASTVTLDSAIFDRPVVNIGFDSEPNLPLSSSVRRFYTRTDHYKQVVETGAVDVVWEPSELALALERALRRPGERSEQRRRLIELECGRVDGQSGRRLAESLKRIHRSDSLLVERV